MQTMQTKNFVLIGHPLAQSISPQIHGRLSALAGRRDSYALRDIEPEAFESAVDGLRQLNGFSVTLPYKVQILPHLHHIDPPAARYGAVNTVRVEEGRFFGYNTDAIGFRQALRVAGIPLKGNVLLCGTGGTARMMACEAAAEGCRITVAGTTVGKAKRFAERLAGDYPDITVHFSALAYLSGSFDLILNATPCGMVPQEDGCAVPVRVARSARAVFDAVYNPAETVLMRLNREAGGRVQGGLPMLVWQAAAAQKIWTGAHFEMEDIQTLCTEMAGLIPGGGAAE